MTLDRDDLEMFADVAAKALHDGGITAWPDMAEMGWPSLAISEDHDGLGGGMLGLGVVLRPAGQVALDQPLVPTLAIAAWLIERCANGEDRESLLADIASGATTYAFAHAEHGGDHAPAQLSSVARSTGDGEWSLSGRKTKVSFADTATKLLVTARDDTGIGLYLIDPQDAESRHYPAIDGTILTDLTFDDTPARRIGNADCSTAIAMALDRATVAACFQACGLMDSINALTLEYLGTRKQFGETIGSFQVLQHRMVDMVTEAALALSAVVRAASACDNDDSDAPFRVSAAKIATDRAAGLIAEETIQMHGGIGVTEEYAAGPLARRLLHSTMRNGDTDWHLTRIGEATGQ